MALASRVTPGSRVADIGTDHARLPIFLLQQEIAERVIATDIREGPLHAAEDALRRRGLRDRADLRLCDGASGVWPDEADCFIIAGMGGDTIAGILRASPWLADKHLLIQPQTHGERVLEVLEAWGKTPEQAVIWENGRRYIYFEVTT
jgi:tRNA (adenine22-N1)-methyltransferase